MMISRYFSHSKLLLGGAAAFLLLVVGCNEGSQPAGKAVDDVQGRLEKAEQHLGESDQALEAAGDKLTALEKAIEELSESCAPAGEPVTIGLAKADGDPERCLSAQGAVVPCDRGAAFVLTRTEMPEEDDGDEQAAAGDGAEGDAEGESDEGKADKSSG